MKEKLCPKCNKTYPIENFPKSGKYLRGYCNECWKIKNREYRKTWYLNHKKECCKDNAKRKKDRINRNINYVDSIKLECSKCGYNKCKKALDFHHIENKDENISIMVQKGLSISRIKKEIEKCIILCSNCHREID